MSTKNDYVDAMPVIEKSWKKTTFGGLVKSMRLCDNISQVDLSKQIGVSPQFLSDVENNRKDVGIEFAKKIADALGYSVEPFVEKLIQDQLKKHHLKYNVVLQKA